MIQSKKNFVILEECEWMLRQLLSELFTLVSTTSCLQFYVSLIFTHSSFALCIIFSCIYIFLVKHATWKSHDIHVSKSLWSEFVSLFINPHIVTNDTL